jgi:hypothetical protein
MTETSMPPAPADVGQVSVALAIAGTFSTVAFAILAAAGVAMTGCCRSRSA